MVLPLTQHLAPNKRQVTLRRDVSAGGRARCYNETEEDGLR